MTLDREGFEAAIDALMGLNPDASNQTRAKAAITAYLSTAPSGQAPLEGVKPIPAWTIAKGVEIPQWLEKVTVRGTGTLRLVAGSDLLVAELADGFDVRAQNPWYREALFVGDGEANDVLIEGGGNGVNLRAVYDIEKPSYHGDILPIVKSALEGWTIDDGTEYQFEQCAEAVAQAIRAALIPASAEPVAEWQVWVEEGSKDTGLSGWVNEEPDMIEHWRSKGRKVRALYASPPASGAVEAGWRIERMLEIIAEAFGLVQALDKRHGPNEIARCQSNLISVLSYEDWTIPADFDELKRLLNLPSAPTEGEK